MARPSSNVSASRPTSLNAIDTALLEKTETAVTLARHHPAQITSIEAWAAAHDLTKKSFTELCVRHYHSHPEELLWQARLAVVSELLWTSNLALDRILQQTGIPITAAFEAGFLGSTGMTPETYRSMRKTPHFTLHLPERYPLAYLRRALSRDQQSVVESLENDTYIFTATFTDGPRIITLNLEAQAVHVSLSTPTSEMRRVHSMVVGILGLTQNTKEFVETATRRGLSRLVEHCPELRVHQTASIYDGILWTIIGQQINLPFAYTLRQRLMKHTGIQLTEKLYSPPTPEAVARLSPTDLLSLQFSRQKADYLISISRLISEGHLNLKPLRLMSATRAEQTLRSVRGLGPWSVNYIMMRSLGFADCLPLGDTSVTSSLWTFFQTEKRPDREATLRLMQLFSPFRSLATAHLWYWNHSKPN